MCLFIRCSKNLNYGELKDLVRNSQNYYDNDKYCCQITAYDGPRNFPLACNQTRNATNVTDAIENMPVILKNQMKLPKNLVVKFQYVETAKKADVLCRFKTLWTVVLNTSSLEE